MSVVGFEEQRQPAVPAPFLSSSSFSRGHQVVGKRTPATGDVKCVPKYAGYFIGVASMASIKLSYKLLLYMQVNAEKHTQVA